MIKRLLGLMAVLVTATGGVAEEPLIWQKSGDTIQLEYRRQTLLSCVQLLFADSNWHTLLSVKAQELKEGPKGMLSLEKKQPGIGGYRSVFKIDGKAAVLKFTYDIPAASKVKFVVVDLFLDKEICTQKSFQKLLETAKGWPRKIVINSKLGQFKVTFSSGWRVRTTVNDKWRPDKQRTVSLLYSTTGNLPLTGEATVKIEPIDSPESALLLQKYRLTSLLAFLRSRYPQIKDWDQLGKKVTAAATTNGLDIAQKELQVVVSRYSNDSEPLPEGIVLPAVKKEQRGQKRLTLRPAVTIHCDNPADLFAGGLLSDELTHYRRIKVVKDKPAEQAVPILLRRNSQLVTRPEEYRLDVANGKIVITGGDAAGIMHGIQTLIQLLKKDPVNGQITVPETSIIDWPDLTLRGQMFFSSKDYTIPADYSDFVKRIIRRMVVRYKSNTFLYGADAGKIRWKSHPELAQSDAISPELLKTVVDYARKCCLEVIPLIESLGHNDRTVEVHPELADQIGKSSLIANKAETLKFLADLFDEAIAIYQSRYFHIGIDEVDSIGASTKLPREQVFVDHIQWCYDYLKGKGVQPIMWHDTLVSLTQFPDVPGTAFKTSDGKNSLADVARKRIPHGMIINYWDYDSRKKDFPALTLLQREGYKTISSSWYDGDNNQSLTVTAAVKQSLGVIGTTWMMESERTPGMGSIVSSARSWNLSKPDWADLKKYADRHWQMSLLPPQPSMMKGIVSRPLPLAAIPGGNAISEGYILLPSDRKRTLQQVNFQLPPAGKAVAVASADKPATIGVGKKVFGLAFLQSDSLNDIPLRKNIGHYSVRYTDGTVVKIPLIHLDNIGAMNSHGNFNHFQNAKLQGLLPNAYRAWQGINGFGAVTSLYSLEWLNPYPEKEISEICLQANDESSISIYLLAVSCFQA